MTNQTLEHKVLGPGNFAGNVPELEKIDSIAEIQARRAGTPLDQLEPESSPEDMQNQWFYGGNVLAHSIRDENHVLELYDLNNEEHFPDKSEFIQTLRKESYYFSKLPDLEDKAGVINLSDNQFNEFVTKDNDAYSHITFKISDVTKGKGPFEDIYGTESTKLFTAMHGEDVYSRGGIKGKFGKNIKTTNIYFQNKEVTVAKLQGKEEGTKVLRGAYLGRLDSDSDVDLSGRFSNGFAHVSGVVDKSGVAGAKQEQYPISHADAQNELKKIVQPTSPLFKPLSDLVDTIYKVK